MTANGCERSPPVPKSRLFANVRDEAKRGSRELSGWFYEAVVLMPEEKCGMCGSVGKGSPRCWRRIGVESRRRWSTV